jgi:alkylation response protein AidB-like acyl-CoA dehydrogenase
MYRTVADAALIEAAQRIAPLVRACRDEGERERRLPAQVLTAMHEARLFRMYIPKALDGLEINPITSMIVVEEIARADAVAAWNLMLGATSGLWAAFLREEVARQIYGAPDAVVAGALRPSGRAPRSTAVLSSTAGGRSPAVSATRRGGMPAAWSSAPTAALRMRLGSRRRNPGSFSFRRRTAN